MKVEKATKKRKVFIITAATFAIILVSVLILNLVFIDNKNIDYERFVINGDSGGANTDIKIVHLSDLHFPKIEVDINKMIEKLKDESPDIIAITGDLIDSRADFGSCGVDVFLDLLKDIAPIYYVEGNHEVQNYESWGKLIRKLKETGIIVLSEVESLNIKINGIDVTLIGLPDNHDYNSEYAYKNLDALTNYKILLAHRPEKWHNYTAKENTVKPNLILAGHAHGGQIRFFGQGLVAPNQGLFPKYDSGLYRTDDNTISMVVSRGIGNSILPHRFNNKPNVPIITIKFNS